MLPCLPPRRPSKPLIGLVFIASGFLFSVNSCAMLPYPAAVVQMQSQQLVVAQVTNNPVTADQATVELGQQTLYQLLVAEFAVQYNQLPLAIKNYLEIAYRTHDPEIIQRTITIATRARDWKRGTEAARFWVSIRPNEVDAHQALAFMLLRSGSPDEVMAELQWMVTSLEEQDPSGRGFDAVSKLLTRESNKVLAIQIMRRIVDKHSNNAYAQFGLANLLASDQHAWRESIPLYHYALELAPGNEQIVELYARVLQRDNRIEDALTVIGRFLERNLDATDARMVYAQILIVAKKDEQALQQLRKIHAQTPDAAEVNYAMGLLLAQTEQLDEAEQAFKRLIHIPERRYAAWYHLAQIHAIQNRVEDALQAYKHVNRGQYRLNAQIQIAILLADQGDLNAARAHLQGITVHHVQEKVNVYRVEATILSDWKKYAEAMQVYNKALLLSPDNDKLLLERAMLAEKLDDLDSLERDLLSIIEKNPDHVDALNSLGYTLADRTTRYDEALGYIQRAYRIDPDSYYIIDSMGWIMYRLRRYQEALGFLRQAVIQQDKVNPNRVDQEIAAHLGEVLWVIGNKAEAQQVWDAALEHQPDNELIINTKKRLGL